VRRELERLEIPGEHEARERSWRLALVAFGAREGEPRRRSRRPLVALTAILGVVAGLLSPPGRAVLDELRQVVGVERSQPALFSLPTAGRLLVTADSGAWVVDRDGSKRRLGDYREASWSPFGRYVVASRRDELVALTPGELRWSLARPDVRYPRWGGTMTDTRIAYLSGGALRVVGGDGKGDRLLDARAAAGAPVWRAGAAHVVVYARGNGSVRAVDADSGEVLDRDAPRSELGRADAAVVRRLLGPSGRYADPVRSPDGRWLAVGWPEADQLVFLRTRGRKQIRAISNVSRQFRSRTFPTISGWCCAP
jgi:hypothetical protein